HFLERSDGGALRQLRILERRAALCVYVDRRRNDAAEFVPGLGELPLEILEDRRDRAVVVGHPSAERRAQDPAAEGDVLDRERFEDAASVLHGSPFASASPRLDSSSCASRRAKLSRAGGTMGIPVERWRALVNFGRNLRWRTRCRRPRNDEEVLRLLQEHRSEHIRAIGSLHSWSEIAQVSGITLDMREFADVRPYANKVQVGAGCTLERLLERLEEINARTLPTMGVIKRQTVSGIISTATHGSGESSLSHFITALRIAA